jgi:uroporphyrinogen-III decarboxylase
MLAETGGIGHVVNLGHGVLPETPIESVDAFFGAVREAEVVEPAEAPA